jgi:replicative DNA helicase
MSDGRHALERSILSAAAFSHQDFFEIEARIGPDAFQTPEHRTLWRVLEHFAQQGEPFDLVLIAERVVKKHPKAEQDIVDVFAATFEQAHLRYYCDRMNDLVAADKIREIAEELTRDSTPDVDEYITKLDDARQRRRDEWVTMADAIASLKEQKENPAAVHSTGLPGLNDALNSGLRDGQLCVVGGRPGAGKSVLMLQMGLAAVTDDQVAAVVSLEMTAAELAGRLENRFQDPNKLEGLPLVFMDSTSNLGTILALLRVLARRKKLGCVVVDYLQLLEVTTGRHDNRERQIATASRNLKRLAIELKVPVIVGSQLNRESAKNEGKPKLTDLRESGAIEQDADVVLLLHSEERDGGFEHNLQVAKNRNGEPGRNISLELKGGQFVFEQIDRDIIETEWIGELP